MRTYHSQLTRATMPLNGVFVFGSNTQGRHGKGAALTAKQQFGARYGQSQGLQGNSYAICTKDLTKNVHPSVSKKVIIEQITRLYELADRCPQLKFYIAYSGTGKNLNAYSPEEMASMFAHQGLASIPDNIVFEHYFAILVARNSGTEVHNKA